MTIPRRGPRDPRGGDRQIASFGALKIPLRRCPEGIGRIGSEDNEVGLKSTQFIKLSLLMHFGFLNHRSQLQWYAVMRTNPSQFTDPDRPVDGVSWIDAAQFCNRLSQAYGFAHAYEIVESEEAPLVYWRENANGFRLPTEAEWEYAARANSSEQNTKYVNGSVLESVAWFRDNSNGETKPIGLKSENDWGFTDLCGKCMGVVP